MLRVKNLVLAGVALALACPVAQAQYWGYGGGATPESAARQGMAAQVRSAGMYNLLSSEAMINVEDARSKAMDNQVKFVNTYFEKRRLNKMYRDAERRPRGSHEDWVRYAQEAAPDELSASQLDKLQGIIEWPRALQGDKFAPYREKLEVLYKEHAEYGGGINSPAYADIQEVGREMQDALRQDAEQIEPEQYVYARRFLESLRYEARSPAGT